MFIVRVSWEFLLQKPKVTFVSMLYAHMQIEKRMKYPSLRYIFLRSLKDVVKSTICYVYKLRLSL